MMFREKKIYRVTSGQKYGGQLLSTIATFDLWTACSHYRSEEKHFVMAYTRFNFQTRSNFLFVKLSITFP